ERDDTHHGVPELAAEGRREPAHHADPRCGEYLLQPAEDRVGRRRHPWTDAARRGTARAYPDTVGNGEAHRQHDGADRRRLQSAAGAAPLAVVASPPQASAAEPQTSRGV